MRMPYKVQGIGGIVGGWLCWLGFHEWTKWTDPKQKYPFSTVWYHQTRKCVRCNISEEMEF